MKKTNIKLISVQKGLTLIELMIALVLSLAVMFAVGNLLITSSRTASLSDSISQTQETGRFAVAFLNRQLMQAGYSSSATDVIPFVPIGNNAFNTQDSTTDNTGDRIAIRRAIDDSNRVSCVGSALLLPDGSIVPEDDIVTDVFWVEVDNNNVSSLRCATYRDSDNSVLSGPNSLAAGVEAMHALYGVSDGLTPNGARNVTRYVRANDVADWTSVYAVKVAMLTRSAEETYGAGIDRNYILLDADMYEFPNARLQRQVFTTTVARANF
ncbi:MAG: PilW family protein [Oleibacter sp.]|nr:PilW family protein [Thalassolituus sp.]